MWFPATKVEVEDVRIAHKKTCEVCEDVPNSRRLKVTTGAGRHQKVKVLCQPCGIEWIKAHMAEGRRAMNYLTNESDRAIRE